MFNIFFQTEAALMYDAVFVMAHALELVDESTVLHLVNLTCEADQAWAFGSSLYNYLNLVSSVGRKRREKLDVGLGVVESRTKKYSIVLMWTSVNHVNTIVKTTRI